MNEISQQQTRLSFLFSLSLRDLEEEEEKKERWLVGGVGGPVVSIMHAVSAYELSHEIGGWMQ